MQVVWLMFLGAIVAWGLTAIRRATRDCEAPLMWCLQRQQGMYGLELAEVTGISHSVIYYYLSRLEEGGKVRREEEPQAGLPRGARRFRYYLVGGN